MTCQFLRKYPQLLLSVYVLPVSSEEGTKNIAEYPDSLVRLVPPVLHDLYPGGVVAGQRDGHGGHGVLHYGEQLDVAEMEVVLVTKPVWSAARLTPRSG